MPPAGGNSLRLQDAQSRWLAPLRSRLLQLADIGSREQIVDLGCGAGTVTRELSHRASGKIWAIDKDETLHDGPAGQYGNAERVVVDGTNLPFPSQSIDMVFCQHSLLWMPLHETIGEIHRILAPGGVLVALEPDYDSMIEYPPEVMVADVWREGLVRAGANINAGRRLPDLLSRRGFAVQVQLASGLQHPSPMRFEQLTQLPLERRELRIVADARRAAMALRGPWEQIYHVPVFGVLATRPDEKGPPAT